MTASTTVQVSHLSPQINAQHLTDLFTTCGKCTVQVLETAEAGRVAIVTFEDEAAARAAVLLTGIPLGDNTIHVTLLPPGQQQTGVGDGSTAAPNAIVPIVPPPNTNSQQWPTHSDGHSHTIYVGNLAAEVNENMLLEYFSSVGAVAAVRFGISKTAQHTQNRFAFVEFESQQLADRALTLNGQLLMGRGLKVGTAQNRVTRDNLTLIPGGQGVSRAQPGPFAAPIVAAEPQSEEDRQRAEEALAKVRAVQDRLNNKLGLPTIATASPPAAATISSPFKQAAGAEPVQARSASDNGRSEQRSSQSHDRPALYGRRDSRSPSRSSDHRRERENYYRRSDRHYQRSRSPYDSRRHPSHGYRRHDRRSPSPRSRRPRYEDIAAERRQAPPRRRPSRDRSPPSRRGDMSSDFKYSDRHPHIQKIPDGHIYDGYRWVPPTTSAAK